MSQLLLLTIFLPLAGALSMGFIAPLGRQAVRYAALAVSLATLALAFTVVHQFPAEGVTTDYAVTEIPWIGPDAGATSTAAWMPDVRFSVGLDGLGVWLFGLSALLLLTSVLVSWEAIVDQIGRAHV